MQDGQSPGTRKPRLSQIWKWKLLTDPTCGQLALRAPDCVKPPDQCISNAAYPTDAPREKQLRARVIPPKPTLWESTHSSVTPTSKSKGIYGDFFY